MRSNLPTRHASRRLAKTLAPGFAVVLLGATLAGCGSSSKTEAGGDSPATDLKTACAKELAFSQAVGAMPFPEGDDATAAEKTAAGDYYDKTIKPALSDLQKNSPSDVTPLITPVSDVLAKFRTNVDYAVLDEPGATTAINEFSAFFYDKCDGQKANADAVEYSFNGAPTTLKAGVTRLQLTNKGVQVHEMVVFRKNDGVTDSFNDVFAGDDVESKVTAISGAVTTPGTKGYVEADLKAGDYVMVCFISVGTKDLAQPVDGPPHFTQGMIHEFTVQ